MDKRCEYCKGDFPSVANSNCAECSLKVFQIVLKKCNEMEKEVKKQIEMLLAKR